MKRVTVKGNKFHVAGDVLETVDVVILNASPVTRAYYPEDFDLADTSSPSAPTCWSTDGQVPSAKVQDKQAARCMDCRHSIRGSSLSGGRACRFSQKLAVAFPEELDTVRQLHVPATAIFAKGKAHALGLQEYAVMLKNHETSAIALVTRISMVDDNGRTRMSFAAQRPLEEEELAVAADVAQTPQAKQCIDLDSFVDQAYVNQSPFEKTDGFTFDSYSEN